MKKQQNARLMKVITGKVNYVIMDGDEVVCMTKNPLGAVQAISNLQKEFPDRNYDLQILED